MPLFMVRTGSGTMDKLPRRSCPAPGDRLLQHSGGDRSAQPQAATMLGQEIGSDQHLPRSLALVSAPEGICRYSIPEKEPVSIHLRVRSL